MDGHHFVDRLRHLPASSFVCLSGCVTLLAFTAFEQLGPVMACHFGVDLLCRRTGPTPLEYPLEP
jgi:hypothetical protein